MNVFFGPEAFVPTVTGSLCSVIVRICTTTDKTVQLAENEVDNLHVLQQQRLADELNRRKAEQRKASRKAKASS
jgi:hypothetical protein